MNKQIKELYEQLDKKGEFVTALALELGMSRKYLLNYWFPQCDITAKYQVKVLNFIKKELSKQKSVTHENT